MSVSHYEYQYLTYSRADLLRDSHLTVEPTDAPAAKSVAPAATVSASKSNKTASVPKRVNGKKMSHIKEPEFKVQRPWGGYHTAA